MHGLIIALQFMTRIPLLIEIEMNEIDFGRSSKFFPIVGLIIGGLLVLAYFLMANLLPLTVIGAVLIILEVLLTGGLHFDGFIDTMDGLFSARPREKIFEIMHDSRVGAHGVTALFCLLIFKYSLLISLPWGYITPLLFLMPMVGRWLMLFTLAFFPYAKPQGLGKTFKEQSKKTDWYLITAIICILTIIFLPKSFLAIYLITFLIILTPILLINKHLLGHTGDTYGAINEITEAVFLLVSIILLQI